MAGPDIRNCHSYIEIFKRTADGYCQSDCTLVNPSLQFVDVIHQDCSVHDASKIIHGQSKNVVPVSHGHCKAT